MHSQVRHIIFLTGDALECINGSMPHLQNTPAYSTKALRGPPGH